MDLDLSKLSAGLSHVVDSLQHELEKILLDGDLAVELNTLEVW